MDLTFVIVIATLFAIVLSAGAFMFFKIQQQAKKNFDLLYKVILPMVRMTDSLIYTQTYSTNILLENAESELISKDKFEMVKHSREAQQALINKLTVDNSNSKAIDSILKEMGL